MELLRNLRKSKGWSQAELARRAQLNAVTVNLIENDRFRPYESQLEKLAAALGVPVEELMEVLGLHDGTRSKKRR